MPSGVDPSLVEAGTSAAAKIAADKSSQRRSLRLVMLAWVFGAAWVNITTGAALTRYAKLMQMPTFGFGLLAALPFAGALMQLFASYVLERFGGRKGVFITVGIIHRGFWLGVAAIPWIFPGAWWWP